MTALKSDAAKRTDAELAAEFRLLNQQLAVLQERHAALLAELNRRDPKQG